MSEKDWERYSKRKCQSCGKKVSNSSSKCRECWLRDKRIDYSNKLNGEKSIDKSFLSKKRWRESNVLKDRDSKKKWLKNNREKRKEVLRKWDKSNPEKKRISAKAYAERHPDRKKAQVMAKKIPLKSYCEKCGSHGEKGRLERHHRDYTKPLEVITLCKCCHLEEHYGRR
jgi:hypothetical protein